VPQTTPISASHLDLLRLLASLVGLLVPHPRLLRMFCCCFLSSTIFTARRSASAVYVMGMCQSVCVCVCLSQVGVLLKWLDGSSWFFGMEASFDQSTLCFKEIQVSTKMRVLFSGIFFLNSGLRKFRRGNRPSNVLSLISRKMATPRA